MEDAIDERIRQGSSYSEMCKQVFELNEEQHMKDIKESLKLFAHQRFEVTGMNLLRKLIKLKYWPDNPTSNQNPLN